VRNGDQKAQVYGFFFKNECTTDDPRTILAYRRGVQQYVQICSFIIIIRIMLLATSRHKVSIMKREVSPKYFLNLVAA